jgi:hypothetical protein
MKPLTLGIAALAVATVIAVPWRVWRSGDAALRARNGQLQQQAEFAAQLRAGNVRLSNLVAAANGPRLSETELTELLRLRNELGQLKWTVKAMEQFRRELQRVQEGLDRLAREAGGPNAATLATDELEKESRRGRAASVKEWIKEKPEQEIPEMKLVSEDEWTSSLLWTPVTDEDFANLASGLRLSGQLKVGRMMSEALKQYAAANDGRFPGDLSELKTYLGSSIDDAVLQRYQIVSADSLIQPLAEAAGEGGKVITQRAPINRERDSRLAVGLKGMRTANTRRPGLWGTAP